MNFIKDIHYFRIPVTDLHQHSKWYEQCLGFTLIELRGEELAVFKLQDGPLLILVQADPESRGHFLKDGSPEFSIGFSCPEIHKFREYLIEQEIKVEDMQVDHGHHYFYFYDPSGNKLQAHW